MSTRVAKKCNVDKMLVFTLLLNKRGYKPSYNRSVKGTGVLQMNNRVLGAALVAAALVVALAGCSSEGARSSASPDSSAAGSAAVAASVSTATAPSPVSTAGAEGVVTLALDYNAGTGYEWACTVEPEGVVTQVDKSTENLAEGESVTGGGLRDLYTFRAQKPGEAVITFNLVRSWEDADPAETQKFAFTVGEDLGMTLNPYKSDFVNEPEWGSNS